MLMTTKLSRVATCGGGTQPSKLRDLLITSSCDKFKKLHYLHLYNTYGHKIWESDN